MSAIALVIHLLQLPSCSNPDVFNYAQFGKLLLQGQSLYSEIITDKPVLTPILYAIPQVFVPNRYWIFKVFLVAGLCFQGALVLTIVRPLPWTGLLVSCVVLFMPLSQTDWDWPSLEHLSNPCVLGVLLLCWTVAKNGRCKAGTAIGIGALLGIAFLIKQTTATTALVPLATLIALRADHWHKFRSLIFIGLAGAGTVVASVGVVYFLGDVERYLYVLFEYHRVYARMASPSEQVTVASYLKLGQESQLLPLITGAAFLASLSRERSVLLAGLAAGVLAVLAPGRAFDHYAVHAFPSIVMALAVGLRNNPILPGWMRETQAVSATAISALLLAMLIPDWSVRTAYEVSRYRKIRNVAAQGEVAAWVDRSFPSAKTMWVIAPMTYEYILFASHKRPANPMRTPWELGRPDLALLYRDDTKLLHDYLESPPELIVVHQSYWTWLANDAPDSPDAKLLAFRILRSLINQYQYRLDPTRFQASVGDASQYVALVLEKTRPSSKGEDRGAMQN